MFSPRDEDQLNDIVETYKSNPAKELEVRFYITDKTDMERVYKALLEKSSSVKIEQVLNTLTDVDKNITDRKEIWFANGKKVSESSLRKHKEKFIRSKGIVDIQIALASETEIPPFSTARAKAIRLKYRCSLGFSEKSLSKWRADFTIVMNVGKTQFTNIISIKDAFFGKSATPKTFPSLFSDEIELELECIDPEVDTDSIKSMINSVFDILDPEWSKTTMYQQKIGELARLVVPDARLLQDFTSGRKTLKQLANQPRTFDFNDYRELLPNISDYYLSDKADGERCFAYFKDQELAVITTSSVLQIQLNKPVPMCVLDCEVVFNKSDKSENPQLYAFDVLYWKKPCTKPTTDIRFDIMHEAVAELRKIYSNLDEKIQVKIKNLQQIKEVYTRKTIYPIDGLIFTPISGHAAKRQMRFESPHNYFDMIVYKWKPPEKQTIDFLVMKCPDKLLGIEPYMKITKHTLFFLFNGITPHEFKRLGLQHSPEYGSMFHGYSFKPGFFPTAFQPSSNPYAYLCWIPDSVALKHEIHGHVVEFGWDFKAQENNWQFHNLRPDRDTQVVKGLGFGNSFRVAETIYNGYQDPFTLDHLLNPDNYKSSVYFSRSKAEIYKPLTKFNAFVKYSVMHQLEKAQRVMDIAGGKGQDLYTLHGLGIRELHVMDIDKEAIAQIDKRKYNLGSKKLYVFDFNPNSKFQLTTQVADLRKPAADLVKNTHYTPATVDGIVMNFAIHYIAADDASLNNLIDFVDSMLRSKGVFIFTCFDGERVFDFLKQNESIDLNASDSGEILKKYSIKKLYSDKKFKPNGLKISAIHPFSDGEYYEEYLVGIKWILAAFRKRKYSVLQYGSFGDLLDKYKQFNPAWFNKMSDHDKLYASLYSYATVVKH